MTSTNNNELDSLVDKSCNEDFETISFDFNKQVREQSWCTSSNSSSCCSLCRLSHMPAEEMDLHLEDDAMATGNLQSSETFDDYFWSSAFTEHRAASLTATAPHNSSTNSSVFASSQTSGHSPSKSCQGCNCLIKNSMIMSSLLSTCDECQISSLNRPVQAKFMTQLASNNTTFSSRKERLSLQSLLFPTFIHRHIDLLTTGFLSEGPLYSILSFLDVSSLVKLRLINSKLRSLASDNNAGWKNHCTMLWSQKVRVCPNARKLLDSTSLPHDNEAVASINSKKIPNCSSRAAMEAYKTSILEAKNNSELSQDDLCFDLSRDKSGVIWSFRFKESAGIDWTSWDPWWNHRSARKLVFMRNGSILQSYPPGRSSTVLTHNSTQLYDVFSERLVQRDGIDTFPPRIEMRWRFVSSCIDLPSRPDGAYVRITVGGRDVPTYVVRRSPNGNWGFIMESCWGIYASFDLAVRVSDTFLSNRVGRRALRRTRTGSRWVHVEDDGEEYVEDTRNIRRRPNPNPNMFIEDNAMSVTGVSQWREALLYNIGAVTLPEGNGSSSQFDAVWQNALLLR